MSTNSYTVTSWDEHVVAGSDTGPHYAHAHATSTYRGVIEGTASVDYLLYYDEATAHGGQRAPGYERVEGSVAGRSGTFVLRHDVAYTANGISDRFTVVPGSATGELAGLEGSGTAASANETVPYTFDYHLPEGGTDSVDPRGGA
ncbi:DUF3224 domain-containing protein [Saccharomonospora glauca]|jgi:hypothetical protein|uniref:DUF3224 domain-containing protein n=1 Tax=Saccharomonospora glauca K62 TaxID=928724 RepID=I1CYC1_9PSEU|nr:DUF3224 domain-containing protein [Saccharomonospora glauca]EIE97695.1 Protein of unknown function (DUF3224) [Saccharomonospora glauca K62]